MKTASKIYAALVFLFLANYRSDHLFVQLLKQHERIQRLLTQMV